MTYPSIRIEGQILSADLIDAIEQGNKHSQDGRDFGFETRVSVKNEIADAWAAARSFWSIYQNKLAKIDETSVATSETRNLWLVPFLAELGYKPDLAPASEVNGKSYAISHRDHSRDDLPIHLMGWGDEMDKRRVGVNRLSPHATLQEYLNVTEHLYGLVSNGRQLRLLRDSSRLIKLTYLEFDLQRMFEEELYADFAILFRLLHASRLPQDQASVSSSIIERYHLDALEDGSRIRDGLRDAVERAMHGIANGLLHQENNTALQELVENEKLTAQELHHALLRLVYRLLFLMVIEERNLVHPAEVPLQKRRIYFDHYSIQRLRRLADRPHLCDKKKTDLWHGLSRTLSLFEESGKGEPLGIQPLGSELFRTEGIAILLDHSLENGTLLHALRALSLFQDGDQSRRVNYSALDVEELGSIYESLLELQPTFEGHAFHYKKLAGSERKTTGSYYTPAPLVQELIKSALIPVLEANLKAVETKEEKEKALLATRICDPACGSGAFLIAAAHHLAFRLAKIRAGEDAHAPAVQRKALRDVVSHCIFGVDINPLSVELCKVSLWLLAVEPGKTLSFLDHHIRCGNSLLGTNPALIAKGIPQTAYKQLLGDTKESCDYMKGLNKDALDGQKQLFDDGSEPWTKLGNMPAVAAQLETADDDTIEARQKKEATYQSLIEGSGYENSRLLADAWCAAFVWPKNSIDYGDALTTEHLIKIEQNPHSISPNLKERIKKISKQYAFFHWHLEFPAVFRIPRKDEQPDFQDSGFSGGFDIMLGNPPWDRMKNDPTEWFASLKPEIATESNTDTRNKKIEELASDNPELFQKWTAAVRQFECTSSLFRNSKLIPLGTKGEADLSTIFADLATRLISTSGRLGLITSSTTVTGKSSVPLLNSWTSNQRLASVWEFINTKRYFKIDSRQRYALLTLTNTGHSKRTAIAFDLVEPTQIPPIDSALSYSDSELELLSPNTKQFPKIGSEMVQSLLIRLARFSPPLKTKQSNPYDFKTAFIYEESKSRAFLSPDRSEEHAVPVLEGKSLAQYNHRFATYEGCSEEDIRNKNPRETNFSELTNPEFTASISTRLYACPKETEFRYNRSFDRPFSFAAREVTNSTNERTVIATAVPRQAILHTAWVFDLKKLTSRQSLCALSILNSLVYDFTARQKISTSHLSKYTWEQLPFYPPTRLYDEIGPSLIPKILELILTAKDMIDVADDVFYPGAPFRWDDDRRHEISCEINAQLFHTYLRSDKNGGWMPATVENGSLRDETKSDLHSLCSHFETPRKAVEYILDTFNGVRDNDKKRTRTEEDVEGTFITKTRILEIYDDILASRQQGREWQSPLDPRPASFRVAHLPRLLGQPRKAQTSSETYFIGVVYSFIRQTRSEATLRTFCYLYDLLQNLEKDQDEWQSILGDDAAPWLSAHNDTLDSTEFLPILNRLRDHHWVEFDSDADILAITDKFKAPENLEWVHYDVSAVLSRITREENIETIQLDSLNIIEGIFKTGTQG